MPSSIYELKLGAEKLEALQFLLNELTSLEEAINNINLASVRAIGAQISETKNDVSNIKQDILAAKEILDVQASDFNSKYSVFLNTYPEFTPLLDRLNELKTTIDDISDENSATAVEVNSTKTEIYKKVEEFLIAFNDTISLRNDISKLNADITDNKTQYDESKEEFIATKERVENELRDLISINTNGLVNDDMVSAATVYSSAKTNELITSSTNKTTLGIDKVDNTPDIDKPISTAVQNELNKKLDSNENAASASKLATPVTINGVAFDGTKGITITDDTKLDITATAADSEKLGGISASEYAKKADISDGLKIGSYLLWSSESTTPAGFLVCDGRSLNKIEYPELFNVIGYTYGGSEESFNIPNFSDGKFFRSVGGNANALGVVQEDELKSHSHNSYTIKGNHSSLGGNWYGFVSNNMTTPTTEVGGVETRPYNMSVVVLIKAKNVKEPNSGQIDNSIYATEAKAGITKLKNSITGNATDTAVTEKAVKSFLGESFDSSKSSNGYTKLPNGLILQWGITDPQNGFIAKPTMFPIAFTSECFGVWVTLEHSQASATTETVVRGHSTTGFLLTASVGVVTSARWLAIGY